jgi:ribonuclease HII
MQQYDHEFPGYGFASNKGYAAPVHRQAIQSLGPTTIHRLTWRPLRDLETRQLPLMQEPGGGEA